MKLQVFQFFDHESVSLVVIVTTFSFVRFINISIGFINISWLFVPLCTSCLQMPFRSNSNLLKSPQIDSNQLKSTQIDSNWLKSTQKTKINSYQLKSTQINSNQLNSNQFKSIQIDLNWSLSTKIDSNWLGSIIDSNWPKSAGQKSSHIDSTWLKLTLIYSIDSNGFKSTHINSL